MFSLRILGLAVVLMCTGCASIVTGHNQSVSVTSSSKGADVSGAKCSLANDKGSWFITTPGSVTVRRSYADLMVNCTLEGEQPGVSLVKSSTKAMALGNVLFGGVVGVGVDMATGAAYDYPMLIAVAMGRTTRIETDAKGNPLVKDVEPGSVAGTSKPETAATPSPPPTSLSSATTPPSPSPSASPQPPTTARPEATATVESPAAAQRPSTASPPTASATKERPVVAGVPGGGQESFQVARMTRSAVCPNPQTSLMEKGPGFEVHSASCPGAAPLLIRCEFGSCGIAK